MTIENQLLERRAWMKGAGRAVLAAGAVGLASAGSPPEPVDIAHRLDAVSNDLLQLTGRLTDINDGMNAPPIPLSPTFSRRC